MALHATILLISRDQEMRQVLTLALPANGFRLQDAGYGNQNSAEKLSNQSDLILVDLDRPEGDGIEVIRQIRSRTHTPIIVLCRRDDEPSLVMALDCGADDYVTKPVNVRNLIAHLRAILRPAPQARLQSQHRRFTRKAS